MALPTFTKTWVISANNRILADATANQAARLMFMVKEFLKTNGYVIKGSSDGTSAGMDGVDRWTDYTKGLTNATNVNAPCSWIVITNGEGVDFAITHQSANVPANAWRLSVSFGGLYTTAATATWTPVASDEQSMSNASLGVQMTDSTALDQVVHLWTSTDRKDFRVFLCSQRSPAGQTWGIMAVNPTIDVSVTWPAKSVAFSLGADSGYIQASTSVGIYGSNSGGTIAIKAKVTPVATPILCNVFFGKESFLGANMIGLQGVFCDLQNDYMVQQINVASTTVNAQGKFGWLIDCWASGRLSGWGGYTVGAKQFYAVGTMLWPWDGATDPLTI